MKTNDTEKLRQRLLTYPGATAEDVENQLEAYKDRDKENAALMSTRGMSNALVEVFLDRKGYQRPPGWHSVFFYPGSNRPRNRLLFLVAIVVVLAYFVF
jgi:hypothetical protein